MCSLRLHDYERSAISLTHLHIAALHGALAVSYGLYSYGLYIHGLYNYDLYCHGLCSVGLYS